MILSDRDFKKRLTTLERVGLKPYFLEEVARGKIPRIKFRAGEAQYIHLGLGFFIIYRNQINYPFLGF